MHALLTETPMAPPLGALHGLAQLLTCVDPDKWNSLGRPAAHDLGALLFTVHADLASAASDMAEQIPPT